MTTRKLSVVSPAFNESANLDDVHQHLRAALDGAGLDWEWIVVDDHSADDTFAVLTAIASADPRVRGLRLSRNSGSHTAIRCAIHYAAGDAIALVASDLQDPPQVLVRMWTEWERGAQVVWAVRGARPGGAVDSKFARLYYWLMRRVAGLSLPPTGADCFLLDRVVADSLNTCRERHTSIFALLTWLGFRQTHITYDKAGRTRGVSGWTFRKKMKLVVDSLVGFSDLPLSWLAGAAMAAMLAAIVIGGRVSADIPMGTGGLATIVLLVAAGMFAALWAVGQYLWRAFDEARARPLWAIESATFDYGRDRGERLDQ
ncbi:MAG: glycosyltransferase family 2 protein [Acidobacteria bacterium]|nr:glycosyltransferase family 2 protein [Acidobacteriota bacterium]